MGMGQISINVHAGNGNINTLQLHDVVYAPDMDANLLSTNTLYDKAYEVSMKPPHGTKILLNSTIIAETVRQGKLIRLKTARLPRSAAKAAAKAATTEKESMMVWHRRMAHLGEDNVKKLPDMAQDVNIDTDTSVGVCASCFKGKQTRHPSKEAQKRGKAPLELIHSDTTGQITPTSISGAKYAATFTDDFTGMMCIMPLKGKTAAELLA